MGTVLLCKNNVCIVFFILISVLVFVSLPQPQKTKKLHQTTRMKLSTDQDIFEYLFKIKTVQRQYKYVTLKYQASVIYM